MPKYGGNKIVAFGLFPKWVKSNRHRERERRTKVSDYNGQYLSPEPMNQSFEMAEGILISDKKSSPRPKLTIFCHNGPKWRMLVQACFSKKSKKVLMVLSNNFFP